MALSYIISQTKQDIGQNHNISYPTCNPALLDNNKLVTFFHNWAKQKEVALFLRAVYSLNTL